VSGSQSADVTPSVLAVDDDRDLADTYALWLDDEFDVETTYGGDEALERIDDDVDVVLLDRRMPGMSGGDVLDAIRERDLGCRVAMLTAVEPSDDIVDMPFDAYVTKPVTKDDLVDVVEDLYTRLELDDTLQEYYSVTSKIAALEADLSPEAQTTSDALSVLRDRAADLEAVATDEMDELDDPEHAFRETDF